MTLFFAVIPGVPNELIQGNYTYNATFCFLRLFQNESPLSLAEIIFLEERFISLTS